MTHEGANGQPENQDQKPTPDVTTPTSDSVIFRSCTYFADAARSRFESRRGYEWKIVLGVWAALAVAIKWTEQTLHPIAAAVVGLLIAGWLWLLCQHHKNDQRLNLFYSDILRRLALGASVSGDLHLLDGENAVAPRWDGQQGRWIRSGNRPTTPLWAYWFQIVVTSLLLLALSAPGIVFRSNSAAIEARLAPVLDRMVDLERHIAAASTAAHDERVRFDQALGSIQSSLDQLGESAQLVRSQYAEIEHALSTPRSDRTRPESPHAAPDASPARESPTDRGRAAQPEPPK